MMKNILITGGTGLVGTHLTQLLLSKGYGVHIFTRKIPNTILNENIKFFEWNTDKNTYDKKAFENVIAIVNLAGAGVADKRWSDTRKAEILNSRVQSGNLLVKALQETKNTIATIIQASATGWYNVDIPFIEKENQFQEDEPAHNDFLGTTCKAWEESIKGVIALQKRLVTIRIGIVLSKKGGMVKELAKPMRYGILPILGNGKQMVPWIHIDDVCNLIIFAIEKNIEGTYNAVSSNPVAQKLLSKQIAKALHKNYFIAPPIPAIILKIMLGEMSIEILKSATINNAKIKKEGYIFKYPNLESIKDL
jgi:uncharacterized protein (TIGR01777 family)